MKDRIKSFGFRVWSGEGDNPNGANAQQADFAIKSDVKLKTMSMKLPSSGLTISKTAITSWTLSLFTVAKCWISEGEKPWTWMSNDFMWRSMSSYQSSLR